MNNQILAHAKVLEIEAILSIILLNDSKKKPAVDPILRQCLKKLQTEYMILQAAVGQIREGSFTKQMKEADKEIVKYFVGLKFMVKGYMHHPDKVLSEKAGMVWNLISHFGRNTHRKGYITKKLSLKQLVNRLQDEEMSDVSKSLPDIEPYLDALKKSCKKLDDLFSNSIIERTNRKNRVQPTAQARKIQKIMNKELLPYLYTMRKVDPVNHEAFARFVANEVKELNAKIRARRTRWAGKAKRKEDNVEEKSFSS